MTVSNKGTALITGASSGIGALYAERLAKQGYDLILVARNKDRLAQLSERLQRETGRSARVVVADLTTPEDLRSVEELLRQDAGITMLVNNAGFGSAATLLDSDPDWLESMIQLNVVALTRLTRAVAPALVARGKGIIVNIASIVALAPEVLNGTYSGTKAYVVNFTQSLHRELGPKGIQVQAVLPGATRTEFWDVAGLPSQHLPSEIVMEATELVDAALAGLAMKELITIPSLPDASEWDRLDSARMALGPKLSLERAAARYKQ
jgi:short-subunit dehydrogenase